MVVQDVQNVCVIHDRHKGILQAINDMKDGSIERYRAPLWTDVKSRWCVTHMKANFHSQFKTKTLTKLFERLCEQKKFGAIWKKLDELTKKTSEEIAKRPVNPEPGEEPISLEDVALDGPQVRHNRGPARVTSDRCVLLEATRRSKRCCGLGVHMVSSA
jgi:hypothetical protein